jgi:hypothetical protein
MDDGPDTQAWLDPRNEHRNPTMVFQQATSDSDKRVDPTPLLTLFLLLLMIAVRGLMIVFNESTKARTSTADSEQGSVRTEHCD